MSESVLNNTTNADFIPTIIAQKCLQRLPAYLNLARTVSRDSDWVTAKVGETIQVPKTGSVVASTKTAGEVFTKQNPTATNVEVKLDTHKEVTFTIDDVTKVLENQDSQNRYAEDGAIALAEVIESALLNLHSTLTYTKTWVRTADSDVIASMLAIRKHFTDRKVPKTEPKYLYVDSTVYNDLLGSALFSRYDARGNGDAITSGKALNAYGMEVFESQLVPTSGSPVAYHNIAYSRNGLVLATRPLPAPQGFGGSYALVNDPATGVALRSLFWYNADLGAHQLTLDVLYGVAVLDQNRVCEVESF